MTVEIFPPDEIVETTVSHLPLSKSVAARALVLAALTPGAALPPADNLPRCADIDILRQALKSDSSEIDCGESGTALRLLTAFFAVQPGREVTLTGSERLAQRPLRPLVDALRTLGADIDYPARQGRGLITLRGHRLSSPGAIGIEAKDSSQFVSALAMIAPLVGPLTIDFRGEIPSLPYLKMTLDMMRRRGVDAEIEGYKVIVPAGQYKPVDAESEADWSAASYWYEIAAVSAGWVTLPGLALPSLQGDSILARLGLRVGVETSAQEGGVDLAASPEMHSRLDLNLADFPDLVPALALTAVLTGVPFEFTGIGHLRHKESDRIQALAENLRKLGCIVSEGPDSLGWDGEAVPIGLLPVIDPHADHRLAMAFAAVAVAIPGIKIKDAECVEKSYPDFWLDLAEAGFTVNR